MFAVLLNGMLTWGSSEISYFVLNVFYPNIITEGAHAIYN